MGVGSIAISSEGKNSRVFLEYDLRHDLELQSPEGSRLTRLIHVLREMANKDQPLAEILKSFSL